MLGLSSLAVLQHPFDHRWVVLCMLAIGSSWLATAKIPDAKNVITVSDTFVFLAAIFIGLEYAVLLAVLCTISESVRYVKKAFTLAVNISIISCSYYLSLSLTQAIFGDLKLLAHHQESFFRYAGALITLGLLQSTLNSLLVIALEVIKDSPALWKIWHAYHNPVLLTCLFGLLTAATVNALIHYFGFWMVSAVLPLLFISYLVARPYLQNIEANKQHVEELNALHLRTLEAFATAVDAKDQITHEHVKRVQIYAEGLAQLLRLSESDIKALHAGALLHDIGKIAVPDYILNKPGKLTAAEFDRMKIHTIVGAQILERIGFPYPLVPVVRHHHERWDGNGYPDGLQGEGIPLTARILTVVDCFDAVREDRQYRKGLTRDQAIEFLIRDKGKHYDPQIVDLFIENLPRFEAQVAKIKKGALAFSPVRIEATEAIRKALPAAGLMDSAASEKPIEYLQMIRAAHQSSQEILSLFEIAQLFNASLDIHETIPQAIKLLESLISFDTCVVYLLDEYGDTAGAHYVVGKNSENFFDHVVQVGGGVTGWVLANNATFANTDPKLDLSFLGAKGEDYRTLAVQPLTSHKQKYGAISLYSQTVGAYSEQQLRGLEQVAKLFSDALRNAALFKELKAQAMTDLLTGLPNMRYLREVFDEEEALPIDERQPLALVMMDLDNFKQVNKAVGRLDGDRALRQIAELMRAQLRRHDVLVRYTSDKFVALRRGIQREAIGEVAVRMQATLFDFRPAALQATEVKLRISIGQAHQGQDGYTLDELIAVAEKRLLVDKAARHSLNEFEAISQPHSNARTYSS